MENGNNCYNEVAKSPPLTFLLFHRSFLLHSPVLGYEPNQILSKQAFRGNFSQFGPTPLRRYYIRAIVAVRRKAPGVDVDNRVTNTIEERNFVELDRYLSRNRRFSYFLFLFFLFLSFFSPQKFGPLLFSFRGP